MPLVGWNVLGYAYGEDTGGGRFHPGVDLNVGAGDADLGLPVRCFADGVVLDLAAWDGVTQGFGNHLRTRHRLADGATFEAHYCHLRDFAPGLAPGQAVCAGQALGTVGKSGGWPWAHLHLELQAVDRGLDADVAGVPLDTLEGWYLDPRTALFLLGHGGLARPPAAGTVSGAAVASAADGAAAAATLAALQADRDFNYRLKMVYEARLRAMEGRRVRLAPGTVDRLIAAARQA